MNFFGFGKKNTAKSAKDRLKMQLEYERALINDSKFKNMKDEIIGVINKYMDVEDLYLTKSKKNNKEILDFEIILKGEK